jgi:hypothetical protein
VETDFLGQIVSAKNARDTYVPGAELHCSEWSMNLDNDAKFQNMTSALHHAKVLEYFTLLGVTLSHRSLLQDPFLSMGDITPLPGRLKPAGGVIAAYELFSQTPQLASITSTVPAGKPMIMVGRSSDAITLVFFHEKPPAGQVGRLSIDLANPGFAGSYAVDRWLLTDATCANRDGLWHTGASQNSGDYHSTLNFTEDTLIVLRLSPTPFLSTANN